MIKLSTIQMLLVFLLFVILGCDCVASEFFVNSNHCGEYYSCSFDCGELNEDETWSEKLSSRPTLDPKNAWIIASLFLEKNVEYKDVKLIDLESIFFLRCGDGWVYVLRFITESKSSCYGIRDPEEIDETIGSVSVVVTMNGSVYSPRISVCEEKPDTGCVHQSAENHTNEK